MYGLVGRVKDVKVKLLNLDDRHIKRFFELASGDFGTCFVCLEELARISGMLDDGDARALGKVLAVTEDSDERALGEALAEIDPINELANRGKINED
jgi:hypothetical protein